jgi:hypothetical protein
MIKGHKYHDVQMLRDRSSVDLETILNFRKQYVEVVCVALEFSFEDDKIIASFRIPNLINMPSKHVGLANWGCA